MSRQLAYGLTVVAFAACGRTGLDASETRRDAESGGVAATASTGGTSLGAGGQSLAGGTRATGGATWQAIGGARIPTGGRATGGNAPTGGRATGGNAPTGGRTPTGGSAPTGGAPIAPSGGRIPAGGTTFIAPTGGRSPTGGTTFIYDTGAQCTYGSCGPCKECAVLSQTCQPLIKGTACTKTDACFTSFACDGLGACQGDSPATPTAPIPARPISGTRTGSPWSNTPLLGPGENSKLRPTFVWRDGASSPCTGVTYELQVDDSCSPNASCTFPSPEIDQKGLTTPSYRPDADLAVNLTPPVGRRYVWRVRACHNALCPPWSSTRYVDVGRAPHDYNGDGYSDLAIGVASGQTVIIWGSASALYSDAVLVATDRQVHNGTTGDINGDGFSDLVAFSYDSVASPPGQLSAYLGSASGLPSVPVWSIPRYAGVDQPIFASADFDGDGYTDLLANTGKVDALADYFGGGPSPFAPANSRSLAPGTTINIQRLKSGDFNADGIADFVTNDVLQGATLIFVSSSGLPNSPSMALTNIFVSGKNPCLAMVDDNGDYRDDLLLGFDGMLYYFRAGASGIPSAPTEKIFNQIAGPQYGTDCTSGSLLGKAGIADLVVSDPGSLAGGTVYTYAGGKSLFQWTGPAINNTSDVASIRYGKRLQIPGDCDGDGFDELVVCDQNSTGSRALVFSGPMTTTSKGTVISPLAGMASFCSDLY